jgi:hypothetical protein
VVAVILLAFAAKAEAQQLSKFVTAQTISGERRSAAALENKTSTV